VWNWDEDQQTWVFEEYPPQGPVNIPNAGYGDAPAPTHVAARLQVALLLMLAAMYLNRARAAFNHYRKI
jgi:hypothetical protein